MRDERGQAGGAEAVFFGLLVFAVMALVVASAWGVIDAKLTAEAAAREAARAYVEAPDAASAMASARRAAADAVAGQGRRPERMELELVEGGFDRCRRVTFEVRYPVRSLRVPWVGGFTSPVIEAIGSHTEIVDPWRSGLEGAAACA